MKIKKILLAFLKTILILLGIIVIAGGAVYLKLRPEINKCKEKAYDILAGMKREDFSMLTDTEVYDKDGNLIGTVNAGHYEYVPISEISLHLQNAYIAKEDRHFKIHNGVDYSGILRAGVAYIKNKGKITQGGSTITQQVVKNTFLTQEKTFTRKITEMLLAPELEKKYSKQDIMEFYCNGNYFGNRCYGAETASKFYFGKDAKDLTAWEAATLAGISNSPTAYDPIKHPEASLEKRNSVLLGMKTEGYLTEEEYNDAVSKPLSATQNFTEGTKENYQTSYAIHCAALELMKNDGFAFQYSFKNKEDYDQYKEKYNTVYGEKSDLIRSGGYKIYTSLDSHIQSMLQAEIDEDLKNFTELQDNGKYALQGSAVCVDNATDYVVAIVGGRGTTDEYNRGYLSARQPGSTIKPLIDYAPAFETGQYYPSRLVNDHQFENGPRNSGGSYYGNVPVREALNRSLNTVAWQILDDLGVDTGIDYLAKMHFMTLSYVDNNNLSMSIGGFTKGARVVDMAKGYSTLANEGMYSEKTCIKSIISQHEGEQYREQNQRKEVFSKDTAYMITDILKGTFTTAYGTARGLELQVPCAGKTGTTNSSKDTWFCGYTRQYTTAVWMGYDTPRAMPGIYGSTYAGKIWRNFMSKLHEGLEAEDWEMPYTVEVCSVKGDGTKSEYETGRTDLFSVNTDVQAEQSLIANQQKKITGEAKSLLENFLDFQINEAKDAYEIDPKYQALKAKLNLIEDETTRSKLMVQLEEKYAELLQVKDSWRDGIAAYEKTVENAKIEERKKAEIQAEINRKENEKKDNIANFETAVSKIEALEYQSDEITALSNDAVEALKKCVSYEEYNALRQRLSDAIAAFPSKTSKQQWQAEQALKASKEAEQKRSEDAAQKKLDSETQQQLKSATAKTGESGGPGVGIIAPAQ